MKSAKNVSSHEGTAGYVLLQHHDELNTLAGNRDKSKLESFVRRIMPEMGDSARKYIENSVLRNINRQSCEKTYFQLYNIYLAGVPGLKLGKTGLGY